MSLVSSTRIVNRALGPTWVLRACLVDIEPVFEHVEIESAHVNHAEVVHLLVDDIRLKLLIGPAHLLDKLLGGMQGIRSISSMSLKATISVSGLKPEILPSRKRAVFLILR